MAASPAEDVEAARPPSRLANARTGPLLAGPALLLVGIFLLLPLGLMFRYSLNRFEPGQFMVEALTLENYAKFFGDPFYRSVLVTTLWVAALSTLFCIVGGLPAAYFIARVTSARLKGLLIILVVLPLLMGNAVRTAGWLVVLGDRGVLNAGLLALGITRDPIVILYTPVAVIIGLTSVLLPFMIITLQSVIEGIDRSVEEAALNLGAGPVTMFTRVIVPLASPGLLAGTLLCFILAMNAYATPVLLGGPKFHMMAPTVYEQIIKVSNWPFGAALSFMLMSMSAAAVIVAGLLMHRRAAR